MKQINYMKQHFVNLTMSKHHQKNGKALHHIKNRIPFSHTILFRLVMQIVEIT